MSRSKAAKVGDMPMAIWRVLRSGRHSQAYGCYHADR